MKLWEVGGVPGTPFSGVWLHFPFPQTKQMEWRDPSWNSSPVPAGRPQGPCAAAAPAAAMEEKPKSMADRLAALLDSVEDTWLVGQGGWGGWMAGWVGWFIRWMIGWSGGLVGWLVGWFEG